MTKDKKRPSEFRRYRQILLATYTLTAMAGFLLLTSSVVAHLFFRSPAVQLPQSSIVTIDTNPRSLLTCNTLVLEQLINLSTKTNSLFALTLSPLGSRAKIGNSKAPIRKGEARVALASEWKRFSNKWQDQWDIIDARCRFSELAETTMGVSYDRMAHVHEALPAMRLRYNSLLAEFDDKQADELFEMRRALDESRMSIQRRIAKSPSTAPASAGGLP